MTTTEADQFSAEERVAVKDRTRELKARGQAPSADDEPAALAKLQGGPSKHLAGAAPAGPELI